LTCGKAKRATDLKLGPYLLHDLVTAQLSLMVGSRQCRKAPRFLSFDATQSLAGRFDLAKSYSTCLKVFG